MCYHRDKRFESKCIAIAQHEGNEREKNAGELMRGKIDFFSFFNSNIYIYFHAKNAWKWEMQGMLCHFMMVK